MDSQQSQLIAELDSEIEMITQAIALDNKNHDLYLYRAILYYQRSQHGGVGFIGTSDGNVLSLGKTDLDAKTFDIDYMDLAIEDATKALTFDNTSPKAYCNRGLFYTEKAKKTNNISLIEPAIDDLNKAIFLDSKDPINYYNRGNAYLEKALQLNDIEILNLAIRDYTKSIKLNHQFPLPFHQRGTAYWNKGKLLANNNSGKIKNDFHHLFLAINDYTSAIELDAEYYDAYYNRGLTYFEMGELTEKEDYFDLAIDDFSILIELDNQDVMAYYQRGKVLWQIEDDEKAMKDFMTVLYCWCMGGAPKSCLLDSLNVLDEKLFTKNAILLQVVQDNNDAAGIEFDLFMVRKLLKDYLLVFKYIGFDYIHLMLRDRRFIKSIPIVVYYLGGCLTSYRFYDEILDKEDVELSAQDYYYYVQSSRQFSDDASVLIGKRSILLDAIDKVSHRLYLNDTDNYYLGLLYFIQSLEEFDDNEKATQLNNARIHFNASNSFIWSKRMLDIINNTTTSRDVFKKYIDENCNASRELIIDSLIEEKATEESFLNQHSDYIHFQEVEAAFIELYDASKNTGFVKQVKFNEPLWQVFKLSDDSIQKLCEKLLELNDNRIIDLIISKIVLNQLTQEEQQFIENNYHYYTFVADKKQAESTIINDIINNGMKWNDLDLILRYLIEKKILDKSQYIFLPLYHKDFVTEIKLAKNITTTRNILFTILGLLTQNWYLVISSEALKNLLNRYLDLIPEIKNEYIKLGELEGFSNNIWKSADELWRQKNSKYYYQSDNLMNNLLV